MLLSDSLGVHDLAFIIMSLNTSPALEVNAFFFSVYISTCFCECLGTGLTSGDWDPVTRFWFIAITSHTCHRASAFPVSAKPFLVCVSEIVTIWYRSCILPCICFRKVSMMKAFGRILFTSLTNKIPSMVFKCSQVSSFIDEGREAVRCFFFS